MAKGRFFLITHKHSDDVWGWNGHILDKATGKRIGLSKVVVDYEFQGEIGYAHCAFDTYAEMRAAALRKIKRIAA